MKKLRSWGCRFIKPFTSSGKSAYLESKALGIEGMRAQHTARLYSRGPEEGSMLALTFDDGPNPDVTPLLLDVLKRYGAKATFFLIGREAISHRDLAQRILEEGHDLGNHTMNHVRCSDESERVLFRQVQDAQDAIRQATGQEALWFRPPFGDLDEGQLHLPMRSGLRTVFWTQKIRDWENANETEIIRQMQSVLHPGSVLALHEKFDSVARALEPILQEMDKRGLRSVGLKELLHIDTASSVKAAVSPSGRINV